MFTEIDFDEFLSAICFLFDGGVETERVQRLMSKGD